MGASERAKERMGASERASERARERGSERAIWGRGSDGASFSIIFWAPRPPEISRKRSKPIETHGASETWFSLDFLIFIKNKNFLRLRRTSNVSFEIHIFSTKKLAFGEKLIHYFKA